MPDEERQALGRIVHSLRSYENAALFEISIWEDNYRRLSDAHKALLGTALPAKFASARNAAHANQRFIEVLHDALAALLQAVRATHLLYYGRRL